MNKSLKVLISVINWNNNAATSACLASIAKILKADQPDIYLTDNNSETQELALDQQITDTLRSIKIVFNTVNKGFAGGHNDAITYALQNNYEYICLLNNDAEILDKLVFKNLTIALEQNYLAVGAAPTILSRTDPPTIWFGGGTMNINKATTQHDNLGKIYSPNSNKKSQNVNFLTGCCLMISLKDKSLDLLLNEEYFLYWEDADWCARMLKNDKQLLYVPSTFLLHHTSSSLGVRSPSYGYYNVRNRLLFAKKWSSSKLVVFGCTWTGFKIIGLSLKRPSTAFKTIWYIKRALFDGVKGNTGPLK